MSLLLERDPLNPKTYLIQQRYWDFTPSSQMPLQNLNSTIRVEIGCGAQGFFDPYSSYMRAVVTALPSDNVGLKYMDTVGQNLIQNVRWTRKGGQVQRVTQNGLFSCIHHQMGGLTSRKKMSGGLIPQRKRQLATGHQQRPYNSNIPMNNFDGTTWTGITGPNVTTTGRIPTQFPSNVISGSNYSPLYAIQVFQKNTLSHVSPQNPFYASTFYESGGTGTVYTANYFAYWGSYKNVRAQYINFNSKGIQTTGSLSSGCMQVSSTTNQGVYPFNYNPSIQYSVVYPAMTNIRIPKPDIPNWDVAASIPNLVQMCGWSRIRDPDVLCHDPDIIISNTVPTVYLDQGIILPAPIPQPSYEIIMAIPSSLFGIRIPPHQYKRLPGVLLDQTVAQISINQYAFTTSGYCDFNQVDNLGMGQQQSRKFIVSQFSIVLDWYDYGINQLMKQKLLYGRPSFETDCWQLLRSDQYSSISQIGGTKQISLPYGRLTEIMFKIIPSTHRVYSGARRNFGLSGNIQQIWLRYGGKYIPAAPITGYSGNYQTTGNLASNYQFMQQLTKSSLYDRNHCTITPKSFALNQRCYDPTNTNTLYDASTYGCFTQGSNNDLEQIYTNPINMDTAMGAMMQNQEVQGTAVYIIPLNQQIVAGQENSVSWLDNTNGNMVELTIQNDKNVNYTGMVMMYVWGCFRRQVYLNGNNNLIEVKF